MTIIENEFCLPEFLREWAEEKGIRILRNVDICSVEDDHVVEYSDESTPEYLNMLYCHSAGIPAVIGETERLIIREISMDDIESFGELLKENPLFLRDSSLAELRDDEFRIRHEAYIKYSYHFLGYGLWGLFLKQDEQEKELTGIAGIDGQDTPELSYALFEKYRGRGLAHEACRFVLKFVHDVLGVERVGLFIDSTNTRSLNLAEKLRTEFDYLDFHVIQ